MNAYSSNNSSFLEASFTTQRGKASELGFGDPSLSANAVSGADSLLPDPLHPSVRGRPCCSWGSALCDPEHTLQFLSQERLVGTGAAPVSDGNKEMIHGIDGTRGFPQAALRISRTVLANHVPTLINSSWIPKTLKTSSLIHFSNKDIPN